LLPFLILWIFFWREFGKILGKLLASLSMKILAPTPMAFSANDDRVSVWHSASGASEAIKMWLDRMHAIVAPLTWMIGSRQTEFYTHSHFGRLRPSWQRALANYKGDSSAPVVLPLSMLAWLSAAKAHALPAHPIDNVEQLLNASRQSDANVEHSLNASRQSDVASSNDNVEQLLNASRQSNNDCRGRIQNMSDVQLLRGCSPKKRAELARLAPLIASLTDSERDVLVEIGTGKGYLARVLSIRYWRHAVGVDGNAHVVAAADHWIGGVAKASARRRIDCSAAGHVAFAECMVPLSMDAEQFNDMMRRATACNDGANCCSWRAVHDGKRDCERVLIDARRQRVLIGLHTCGDLASTMLRLFLASDTNVGALIGVGCCYHRIDYADCGAFPLSTHFRGERRWRELLDMHAGDLACHHISAWAGDRALLPVHACKSHGYRAILEWLVANCCTDVDASLAQSVRYRSRVTNRLHSLDGYLRGVHEFLLLRYPAFARSLLDNVLAPRVHELDERVVDFERTWHRAAVFFSLRQQLAPLLESMLLLDRLLFVVERAPCNATLALLPILPCSQSPRNFTFLLFR
jgi:Methyltransferase domain